MTTAESLASVDSSACQSDSVLPRSPWWATLAALAVALVCTVPTTGDIGLTWDEPSYRYSQVLSIQWYEGVCQARSWDELRTWFDRDALAYYWPYGRFGINFHPPLAGQLNLLTHQLFGGWMKDIPSRRLAAVLEYALVLTMLFHVLARRYGPWVGATASLALLTMPRVYADGHVATTDMPGLLLWAIAGFAFWRGLSRPDARLNRTLVGITLGLCFVEKMAAVLVALPIALWLAGRFLGGVVRGEVKRADWIDGLVTLGLLGLPVGLAGWEIQRLTTLLPPPNQYSVFATPPESWLPNGFLAVPSVVWLARRVLFRLRRGHRVWGTDRPALEIAAACLAFPPLIGWLGNPAWWVETFPRLAHYVMLNQARQGVLPSIYILYFGETYSYSLPWHNAFVLTAIMTPAALLIAAGVGLIKVPWGLLSRPRDLFPLYCLMHMMVLPIVRMFNTPAHDGIRLFLPTFLFLAAFVGWGVIGLADLLARLAPRWRTWLRAGLVGLTIGSSAIQLIRIHPYELSYYNELIGGPRGAWNNGFELAYWFDAFTPEVFAELNKRFPENAVINFPNKLSEPPTFLESQWLGHLRGDLLIGDAPDRLTYKWLLTQDAKASGFSRLLFVMTPWYESRPAQLDGLRVVTVADPVAVSRALALALLTDVPKGPIVTQGELPGWVEPWARWFPGLGRFWGVGLSKLDTLDVYEPVFEWAATDPEGLRAAAKALAHGVNQPDNLGDVRRLRAILDRIPPDTSNPSWERLLKLRPEALIEAVEILIARPEAVRRVLTRSAYTDPTAIGGYLDERPDLAGDG